MTTSNPKFKRPGQRVIIKYGILSTGTGTVSNITVTRAGVLKLKIQEKQKK